MQRSDTLSLDVFKSHIAKKQENQMSSMAIESSETFHIQFPRELPTIKEATQMLLAEDMKRANDNKTKAAGMLGISRQALSKRLKSLNSKDKNLYPWLKLKSILPDPYNFCFYPRLCNFG